LLTSTGSSFINNPDRTGPKLRTPSGAYRLAATASYASAREFTIGTTTASAPASNALPGHGV